ncbi:MAG: HzsA-related protein, partial [Planctomycetota bacterium]
LKNVPKTRGTRHYSVFEIPIDPRTGAKRGEARMATPDMGHDVDNYYACYLPNDNIIFASTASYEGVPCVGGGAYVANLYLMDKGGSNVRRLTFDQDASWHPSLQANGRVMYVRWEYTDSAHYYSRLLMTMNPDGSDQKAYYGSNSYWPNSMFFPRQVPGAGNENKFVASITGHHSHAKGGAACVFDVSVGRQEADGALQLLMGRGKPVEPLVIDNLCGSYDPKFYHTFPLSEKYFLTCANNSVYLVDAFDNLLCIKKADSGGGYWEPIPLRKTKRPPVVPDRVNPASRQVTVLLNDVYLGPGLAGVPRGTVKSMRIYRYEYGPRHKGGHYSMGMEAGWDAKQVLGTVPVEDDGSASFIVPANSPFAMQPLDAGGRALQLMRSWTVGMPGEFLSCVGCHESQNTPPAPRRAKAMLRKPSTIEPFYGPARGFSFQREMQPVLDKYCVGCHDGSKDLAEDGSDRKGRYKVPDRIIGTGDNTGKKFAECGIPDFSNPRSAHRMLHPYVRRNGPEGDYHLLPPLEFHADTSELAQMLKKGHHNVKLDKVSWDRIYTWMDMNAPFHGTWSEAGANKDILDRRMELRRLYANDIYNPETIVNPYQKKSEFVTPERREADVVERTPADVRKREREPLELDLGDGAKMKLVSIPSGSFSMGSNDETPVEQPVTRVRIRSPFYMGATEVTLGQFRKFDPEYLN